MGLYSGTKSYSGMKGMSRSKGSWKVFQACADVSQTHHQRQLPTPRPGGAALPPTPGLVRPGRTWNISQASIPIIHRQRLLVTQRIWGWLVCAAPRQLRSSRQRTSAGEQPRAAGPNPRMPAPVLRTSQEISFHPHK